MTSAVQEAERASLAVRSRDGTRIAYETHGSGPAVILVDGALCSRVFGPLPTFAPLLAQHFTVYLYDRRGRGQSGDTPPYAVEREIEDLDALVEAAGGAASIWGWSSGGALVLRAAARGLNLERLAIYEAPFMVDDSGRLPPPDFAERLDVLVAADRRSAAVRHYMTKGMGIPPAIVTLMRLAPFWSKLKAVAHTLPYDWAVLGDTMRGRPLSAGGWATVTAPALVIAGEKSPAQLRNAARALAEVLPNAEHRTLEGQSHNPSMKALAPVLEEFFAASRPARVNAA
jgi:pimeloyl-ACP methyl ester carboxylesterase